METGLRLLMRDGALHVTFRPRFTAEQYAELALLIQHPATKAELCEALKKWAKSQDIEVVCDE
jgi:hypothetical protein